MQKGSNRSVMTYAFYDNGSDGYYYIKELNDELQAVGVDTALQLRTMQVQSCISIVTISNLVVTEGGNPIVLPKAFTRN